MEQAEYRLKAEWVFWEAYKGARQDDFDEFNKQIVTFGSL